MKNISKFQLILLLIFGGLIVIGVIVISARRGGDSETLGTVTVWGPYSGPVFSEVMKQTGLDKSETISVEYRQVASSEFSATFVNELAEGRAPDLVLISHEALIEHKSKLTPLPYSAFSERDFKDSFIDGAEIYLSSGGSMALPLVVDPLVMYWNRTLFSNSGLTQPPRFWSEFTNTLASRLTKKDERLVISQSATALGEYQNIRNATGIVGALLLQAGTPVTTVTDSSNVVSVLNAHSGETLVPGYAALDFYTQFANPTKTTYSWNRSLPRDDEFFLTGNLATYFGKASELFSIQERNPNLNFDVAVIPQSQTNPDRITYGTIYGASIPQMARNKTAAFQVAQILSSRDGVQAFANVLGLPPARRDLLGVPQSDAFRSVFYNSTIWTRGFLQPRSSDTESIFRTMIESVTSGSARTTSAVDRAHATLQDLLKGVSY